MGNRTCDNTVAGATVNYAVDIGTNNNQYAYDALGRRIRKIDTVASETTLYYNNYNWQVLAECDGSNNCLRYFVYGNYIDEPLLMVDVNASPDVDYYYVHDHLYSPVALLASDGTVAEYYEYNAYGKCHAHTAPGNDGVWLTGDDTIANSSAKGNPYAFTGRTLDVLDGGDMEIMYYRNRYYKPSIGRFMQNDPLGILLTPSKKIRFRVHDQYHQGSNLLQYCSSRPVDHTDPSGTVMYYCNIDGAFTLNRLRHGYMWSTETDNPDSATGKGQSCGRNGSFGCEIMKNNKNGFPDGGEPGPDSNPNCTEIAGSDAPGMDACMMNFCKSKGNNGPFFPYLNDCHNTVKNAAAACGLKMVDKNGNPIPTPRIEW